MKLLITILQTLILSNLLAQEIDIKKIWVGNNLEFIAIDSQKVDIEIFGNYSQQKRYYLIGDTLRLFDKYTTSRDNYSKEHIRNYDFRVANLTDTTLSLIALDSNSLDLVGGMKYINYRERHVIKRPVIVFELLKFSSTDCALGQCPSLTLQIDKEKRLLFIGGRYAIRQGFYKATLSDSLFSSLINLLKLSDLDNLKTWRQHVMDAPEYTLEIHYNDTIKYIKNFFLPAVVNDLIIFLLHIPKKVELVEQKDPFKINFSVN